MHLNWLQKTARCIVCDMTRGDPLCADCEHDFFDPGKARCAQCAVPTAAAHDGAICGRCLGQPPHFDATTALADYAPPVDGMIGALKFSARLDLAAVFGRLLARRVVAASEDALCVPVPLAGERAADRGYNQSLLIARAFTRAAGFELAADRIVRVRHGAPQQSLPLEERRRNVRGAFAVSGAVVGRSLLVVDDVMTSGSTIDEVARICKAAGARRVEAVVVARTP